jgi:hypothetical protein
MKAVTEFPHVTAANDHTVQIRSCTQFRAFLLSRIHLRCLHFRVFPIPRMNLRQAQQGP